MGFLSNSVLVMVSAQVVCALVLQMDDLGSILTVHDVTTSLAVVSLLRKKFSCTHKASHPYTSQHSGWESGLAWKENS